MWTTEKWRAVLLDFLERAGWSAGEIFFATLLAGGTAVSVATLPWAYALTLAFSAAISSVILTALQYLAKKTDLTFWPDLIVRLGKTFLGSLAASVAAATVFDVTAFDWSTALNVATVTTLAALGKGLLARQQPAPAAATTPPAATADAPPAPEPRLTPSTLPTDKYVAAVTH